MSDLSERVRVHSVAVLSDDWYLLQKTTFDFKRSDGTWQRQSRETYDRGNGATILLYNRSKRTVILTRQFRYPAFVNGYRNLLIETPAGLLDERFSGRGDPQGNRRRDRVCDPRCAQGI